MMGRWHARSESLFYYFRLEDQFQRIHPLRVIDKHIDFWLRSPACRGQLQRYRSTVD